ncbi:hypothetical protein [Peribacillus sp. R9-11]|uniref:hypothetical protein n=1 Tax=Peribacillus sp. R9-11 TaxID=3073271 RepID=UPI002868C115|nr:hypothetical protein [Peribacillus sp. R9-11]WMX58986.1 hypothetical protein RE409_30335 [Peribacillus sp. R9-11]
MKLKFEEWLVEQGIDKDSEVNELFIEGITCYKASAYRAALLFSFLGFQTMIKHRILNSKPAENYAIGEWDQLKINLQNDDVWDKKIIESIQNKQKPIFKVSEDLREQYVFWKNRRNDCAHAKGNTISYPHVESFWLFLQSNLPKFVVNGGREFILQSIKNHFDPTRTPVGITIDPIILKIKTSIDIVDYKEFLQKLKDFTIDYDLINSIINMNDNLANMWHSLFQLPEVYCDVLVDFLVSDPPFCLDILRVKQQMVQYFHRKSTFIRMLWKKDFNRDSDYKVFIGLLRYNLIPKDQISEAYKHVLENISTQYFDEDSSWLYGEDGIINENEKMVLLDRGFFGEFEKIAFEQKKVVYDFNWGNLNKELFVYYIRHFGLNKRFVESINDALYRANPPFKLRDELKLFYKNEPVYLEKHREISDEFGFLMPEYFR